MTIAMAGFSTLGEFIVTVSDARLSHGDAIPAIDDGTMKNRKIASTWGMMFAASDASAFVPVAADTQKALSAHYKPGAAVASADVVQTAVRSAYEKEFQERFVREHLARLGYSSVSDFRSNGLTEMGKELYGDYAIELAKFDLGLELLVYGFDERGFANLFEVANPGKISSHKLREFAAIGSGAWMALAALNRKPITRDNTVSNIAETVYRLLDAKFSSETASGVGRATNVFIMAKDGKVGTLYPWDIQKLRTIWDEQMRAPEPESAIDLITKSQAVQSVLP
jgi:20S proteasome alpha/beta subunit